MKWFFEAAEVVLGQLSKGGRWVNVTVGARRTSVMEAEVVHETAQFESSRVDAF